MKKLLIVLIVIIIIAISIFYFGRNYFFHKNSIPATASGTMIFNSEGNNTGIINASSIATPKNPSNQSNNSSNKTENNSLSNPSTVIAMVPSVPMSSKSLGNSMRHWILNDTFSPDYYSNPSKIAWSKQWIDNISDSELLSVFKEANGPNAINKKEITIEEFDKATMLLSEKVEKGPTPFTLNQATKYIQELLSKSYPGEKISKVEEDKLNYIVYATPNSNPAPFCYVNKYTGYMNGA